MRPGRKLAAGRRREHDRVWSSCGRAYHADGRVGPAGRAGGRYNRARASCGPPGVNDSRLPEVRAPVTETRLPWGMLVTISVVTFLVNGSAIALAPFLLDVSRDLGVTLGAAANLIAIMSISWGVVSVTAGAASDRIGRRPVLVAAVLALGAARLGLALSHSYAASALWQLLAGVGGGGFMGTVFAAVSDRVAVAQHGRALGWVLTGQSLSMVAAVPLVTLLGAVGGWRVAIGAQAATALVSAAAVWLVVPGGVAARGAGGPARANLRGLLGPRIIALLLASTMERTCFAAVAVYAATFL